MPQPKSSRSSSTRTRKPAAASRGSTTAKRSASGQAPKRTTAAKSTARSTTKSAGATISRDDSVHANLNALRDHLRKGVVLTADGLKSAMDDAVKHGQLTRKDATALSRHLLSEGRTQADGFRKDLEHILGRGRTRAVKSGDRVLREADRARRRVGVGASFPITRYDELNATQSQGRLNDLTPAQLRKVRDYEKRHANRKSVLSAVERKLG